MSGGVRILICAGEVSGDLYAAQLVEALRHRAGTESPLRIKAVAGPRTRMAGAELLSDSTHRAALGFIAPLRHLIPSVVTAVRMLRLVRNWRPHAVVLLDYPGFNIPLVGVLKRMGVGPVIYYMPPEECIWGRKGSRRVDRAQHVVRGCERLLTTHETDTAFYSAEGAKVDRVGHPLLDLVRGSGPDPGRNGTTVALLPASRRQELGLLWPALEQTAVHMVRARPGLRFLVPLAAAHLRPAMQRVLTGAQRRHPELSGLLRLVEPTSDAPHAALAVARQSDVAVSKSGSVTLELALADVPHLLVFRIDRITEWLGRRFLHLSEQDFPHMALPNFILDRPLVPEFKQHGVDPTRMASTALDLLDPASTERRAQLAGFAELRAALGGAGVAGRSARIILDLARKSASAA